MGRFSGVMGIIALVLANPAAAGNADTYPSDWEGVWEIQTTLEECGSGDILSQSTVLDTICAGQRYEQDDPEGILTCQTTVTSTTIESTCSGVIESFPAGCEYTLLSTFNAERVGDTVTGSGMTTTAFTPECGLEDMCVAVSYLANRIGGATGCDVTPVHVSTWGRVKAIYR